MFIKDLREKVQSKFGKKISSKKDAIELREMIFLKNKRYLSESTIRRFFYLVPSVKSSLTTLNIFSEYLGYKNFEDFINYHENIFLTSLKKDIDNSIIETIKIKDALSVFEINLLSSRIVELLKANNKKKLIQYFNNDHLYNLLINNISLNELFAQIIGPNLSLLKKSEINDLIKTKYFIDLILNKYVDINNKNLEEFYLVLLKDSTNNIQKSFAASILSLNKVYENNYDLAKFYLNQIEVS